MIAGRRLRDALRVALLLGFSLATSVALAEWAVRIVRPQPLGFSYLSEDGLVLHTPNRTGRYQRDEFDTRVRINSAGFRGAEFAVPKPPGTFRILVLGDSFAEGLQVQDEETFAVRLEAGFSGGPHRVDVLNLGVSGFGTSDELALLRLWGPRLEPDLVLVLFCLINDVRNNVQSDLCRLENGRLVCRLPERPSPRRLAAAHLRAELGAHLHLYQLLRAATTDPFFQRIGLRAPTPPESPAEMPFTDDLFRDPAPEYLTRGYQLTQEVLRELVASAVGLGAETWLVLIPIREQIWDREWNATAAAQSGLLVRDAPQRAMRARAREIGMPVIDLYDAFRASNGAGETLYWKLDAHFDAAGHALAAREVDAALRARGIPPPPPQ